MQQGYWTNNIYDIKGTKLITSREAISEDIIEKTIADNKIPTSQIPLSRTQLLNDVISIINCGIYKQLFEEKKSTARVIDAISTAKLAEFLIQELEKLKDDLPQTYHHILVVAALSVKICLDISTRRFDPHKIACIGLTHDIGKSRLPVEVLEKTEPLTNSEFELIQTHPWIDHLLVSHYLNSTKTFLAQAALLHHERLDGSGYPLGLARINSYVQAIMPCDIFDALISQRPYRSGPFTMRAALDLLLRESNEGKINHKFVRCLISYARKEKPNFRDVKISLENRDAPPEINHYGVRAA